jgi:hypothetical protein
MNNVWKVASIVFLSAAGVSLCISIFFFLQGGDAAGFGGTMTLLFSLLLGSAGFGVRNWSRSNDVSNVQKPVSVTKRIRDILLLLGVAVWGYFMLGGHF